MREIRPRGPEQVDREVVRQFWVEQGHEAADPRSVVLERAPLIWVRLGVALRRRWLLSRLDARRKGRFTRVVDLGCGRGDWTGELARRADHVVAVDLSPGFLAECRRRVAAVAPGAKLDTICSDLESVELPRENDVIIIGAVLQCLGDADAVAVLRRASRALSPGGLLYVRATVARGAASRRPHQPGYDAVYRSAAWYREVFAACGLRVIDQAWTTRSLPAEAVRAVLPRALGFLAPVLAAPVSLGWGMWARARPLEVASWLLVREEPALAALQAAA